MINITTQKFFLYNSPVHMLKSFEGLSSIVQQEFPGELYTGAYFIFLNKNCKCMKILTWDGDGYAIYYKRLEKGRFFVNSNVKCNLTRREFLMLFEGIKAAYTDTRFSLK